MDSQSGFAPKELTPATLESLQELLTELNDSVSFHLRASEAIKDDDITKVLREIAWERHQLCDEIGRHVRYSGEKPNDDGTFAGSLRAIWTEFRSALNSGDSAVVLIEAARAEDVTLNSLKTILKRIAGNPINDVLQKLIVCVNNGRNHVIALRDEMKKK